MYTQCVSNFVNTTPPTIVSRSFLNFTGLKIQDENDVWL